MSTRRVRWLTHACMWRASFIRVTWRDTHSCMSGSDMSESCHTEGLSRVTRIDEYKKGEVTHSCIRMACLIHTCDVTWDTLMYDVAHILMSHVTQRAESCHTCRWVQEGWGDSLMHTCGMPHLCHLWVSHEYYDLLISITSCSWMWVTNITDFTNMMSHEYYHHDLLISITSCSWMWLDSRRCKWVSHEHDTLV